MARIFGLGDVGAELLRVQHSLWAAASCVAFSPEAGELLAVGGDDGRVSVFDTRSGVAVLTLEHANGFGVRSVAFSPAGMALASGGLGGFIKVYDVDSGAENVEINHCAGRLRYVDGGDARQMCVDAVAFSPEGDCIGGRDELGVVKVFDTATGQEPADFRSGTVGRDTWLRVLECGAGARLDGFVATCVTGDGVSVRSVGSSDSGDEGREVLFWAAPRVGDMSAVGMERGGLLVVPRPFDAQVVLLVPRSKGGAQALWAKGRKSQRLAANASNRND